MKPAQPKWRTTRAVPIEKTCGGYILIMSQGFKVASLGLTDYILFSVVNRSTSPDMTRVFHERPYCRFTEIKGNLRIKKLYRMNQDSNFPGTFLAIEKEPQSNSRRKNNYIILKGDSSRSTNPFIFMSKAPQLFEWANEVRLVFPSLKLTNHCLSYSTVSHWSNLNSEAIFSCC